MARALIYLDTCCLNRPFDDQRSARIRLESEAVRVILARLEASELDWVVGEPLLAEVSRIADAERAGRVKALLQLPHRVVVVETEVIEAARRLMSEGFAAADALHLAAARRASCDVFLTTDDTLLRRTRKQPIALGIRVENPASWVLSLEEP